MTAAISMARVGGVRSSRDSDSVRISGWIGGECRAKIWAAFEVAEDMCLLGEVGLHRVGVWGAEVNEFLSYTISNWQDEYQVTIYTKESRLVDWP